MAAARTSGASVINAERILSVLDSHLDHEVSLVIYGRAAVALGFANPPESVSETLDVDGIIPLAQIARFQSDGNFWDAQETTNRELEKEGLYITHFEGCLRAGQTTGAGNGESTMKQDGPPLPGPLLPRREERGKAPLLFCANSMVPLSSRSSRGKEVGSVFYPVVCSVIILLAAPLLGRCAEPATPLPSSPVIKHIQWAPKETIRRQAKGSDNWPMTWGDDDALYTAYGDGNGFEPFLPKKLSLGFAKVIGMPPNFSGVNIRSETGEQFGDGPRGKKASGILMKGGVLYLWARNAANAQLAWSGDHGATWTWSDWRFTNSFGCPTFLNFGRNYAGARDEFAYIYSPDRDSAYEPGDRMMLARVPAGQVKERAAYEFFQGVEAAGKPVWTADLAARGTVLSHPGRCYRPGVTYNAALRRYLLVMTLPGPRSRDAGGRIDTRFTGGLAVYDAPEPWGPWTTAYFAEQWDLGPGDTASFPSKWISADGKTAWLVFSSEDSFSVRKATFVVE